MINLRDLSINDLDSVMRWRNDPAVNRYLADRLKTRKELDAWYERLRIDPKIWLKAVLAGERLIGCASVESIDEKNRKCELGLIIGEADCWGAGVGRMVFREMLRYAFEDLGMHRVWAAVARGNRRSIRLVNRAGFVQEGVMREAIIMAGEHTDLLCYSMLENEYRPADS